MPAIMFIYNDVDKAVGHYRRYTRGPLIKLVEQAGFKVQKARYVDSLGFFAWAMLKFIGSSKQGELNRGAVIAYDRLVFPLSLVGDLLLGRICGKNLLVIATKP